MANGKTTEILDGIADIARKRREIDRLWLVEIGRLQDRASTNAELSLVSRLIDAIQANIDYMTTLVDDHRELTVNQTQHNKG